MDREYEFADDLALEASPEEIWDAIATGPGTDAWFMGRSHIEGAEGGRMTTDLGGFELQSTVTAWDPPRHFAHRSDPSPDGSFRAFEYLIEGREESNTVLRIVSSGFFGGEDWEAEYDGWLRGGPLYPHNLTQYLNHFRGNVATPVGAGLPVAVDTDGFWRLLRRGLALPPALHRGDDVKLSAGGPSPIVGTIDYLSPSILGVRAADGLYRFIHGIHGAVVIGHHLFDGSDSLHANTIWQGWLQQAYTADLS